MRAVLAKANEKAGERNKTRWKNDPEKMRKIAAKNAAKGTAKLTGSHFDADRLERHSAALKGRVLGGKMKKGPKNRLAKNFVLRDSDGAEHRGRNILNFVRSNPQLFDAADLIEVRGTCRAAKALSGLRRSLKNAKPSWKGWVWGG
jgi:hypothetical protein